jgi:hypothetical protein
LNPRPPGYEPGELPDCSTPRRVLQEPRTVRRYSNRWRTVWSGPEPPRPVRSVNSESELSAPPRRAGNGTRTRDPNLGKVVLYQLSYSRDADDFSVPPAPAQRPTFPGFTRPKRGHGGEGDRTPDLVNAIHALSQLSYAPAKFSRLRPAPRQHGNVAVAAPSVNEVRSGHTGANAFVSTALPQP